MMKQPALGRKILELRQQKGLTQEELVQQCNISVRTIQRIEAGETTPRVYTIKSILSALDRDLDDLREDSIFETKVKEVMLLEIDERKDVSFLIKNLNIGWVAGILSMIAFIFQFIEDTYYIAKGTYYIGEVFYIVLGIFSILFFAFHMRAFVLIGELFKSYLLKVAAILLLGVNTLLILYSIVDLHYNYMPQEAYGLIFCIFYGLMYAVFGYALYKLRGLGQLPRVTGIMQMITGGMLLTILFAIVAVPASIIIQGLTVGIILKAIEITKKELRAE